MDIYRTSNISFLFLIYYPLQTLQTMHQKFYNSSSRITYINVNLSKNWYNNTLSSVFRYHLLNPVISQQLCHPFHTVLSAAFIMSILTSPVSAVLLFCCLANTLTNVQINWANNADTISPRAMANFNKNVLNQGFTYCVNYIKYMMVIQSQNCACNI